jgi:hypothetical protein
MAEQLSATEELQLGLSKALYGVARVLRLSKLRDLLSAARLGPDATVYLLGRRYCCPPHATEAQQEEALARMLLHFHSIPWMTYRTGFTPIAVGDVQLRSDAGWGCTLRRWAARQGFAALPARARLHAPVEFGLVQTSLLPWLQG